MKAISVNIYRTNRSVDCSNGGISSRFDEVLIPCETGWIEVDETNPPENLCRIVTRNLGFMEYTHCEPYAAVRKGSVGWMNGGAIVNTCDSRFSEISGGYPLCLHDRQETQAEYDMYSH